MLALTRLQKCLLAPSSLLLSCIVNLEIALISLLDGINSFVSPHLAHFTYIPLPFSAALAISCMQRINETQTSVGLELPSRLHDRRGVLDPW
jgi:hypothetical protein